MDHTKNFSNNVIMLNVYSFIPQFIISGMVPKHTDEEVKQIKKSIRDAINILSGDKFTSQDTTVIFYGSCDISKIEEVGKVISEDGQTNLFTNMAAINWKEQMVNLNMDTIQFKIPLEQFADLEKTSVKLAHALVNHYNVEKVIMFGLNSEMRQLELLGAYTHNVRSDKEFPMNDFTYLGLYFDFETVQPLDEVSASVVVESLVEFVLPILKKANSLVGKTLLQVSSWFK